MATVRSVVRPLVVAFSIRNRTRKAALIGDWLAAHDVETLLLVGAGGPGGAGANEDVVEAALAARFDVVMAVNVVEKRTPYPFRVADGRELPFADRYVDAAVSNAIIEHVGDEADQRRFVAEQVRVARCFAITTPNRWFPVESHTSAVFRHWSAAWRRRHEKEFTRLLSRREFVALLPPGTHVHGRPWSATFVALFDGGAGPRERPDHTP